MNIQGKVWGYTSSLFNKNNVEIHLLQADKGGYCSKHYHKSKYNRFFVIKGILKITVWKDYGTETLEDVTILGTGMECTVPPGDFHRFEALEDTDALEIYWVDLRENDIVREDHGGMKTDETQTDTSDEIEGYRSEYEPIRRAIFTDLNSCSNQDCGIFCHHRTTPVSNL
jgi:quercetin dioxygenase-like cupin family protein